jgi:hypothetical protein
VFNQFGDLERCALRAGNVHSADGWDDVLKPVVARYQGNEWPDQTLDQVFGLPEVLDYRFRESCHKRGIHLSFQAPMCAGALRTKD